MKKLIIVAVSIILLVAISFTVVAMNTVKCSPWAEKYFEECGIKSTFGKDAEEAITVAEVFDIMDLMVFKADVDASDIIAVRTLRYEYAEDDFITRGELSECLVASGLIPSSTGNKADYVVDIKGHKSEKEIKQMINGGFLINSYSADGGVFFPDRAITRQEFLVIMHKVASVNNISSELLGDAFKQVIW